MPYKDKQKDREYHSAWNKIHYSSEENREKRRKRVRIWIAKNRKTINKKNRDRLRKRYGNDPQFRIKLKEAHRRHYLKYRDRYRKKLKRQRNSLKGMARQITHYARKMGIIKKPDECSKCLIKTDGIIAHHNDYLKPLEITWLCKKCHGIEHRLKE